MDTSDVKVGFFMLSPHINATVRQEGSEKERVLTFHHLPGNKMTLNLGEWNGLLSEAKYINNGVHEQWRKIDAEQNEATYPWKGTTNPEVLVNRIKFIFEMIVAFLPKEALYRKQREWLRENLLPVVETALEIDPLHSTREDLTDGINTVFEIIQAFIPEDALHREQREWLRGILDSDMDAALKLRLLLDRKLNSYRIGDTKRIRIRFTGKHSQVHFFEYDPKTTAVVTLMQFSFVEWTEFYKHVTDINSLMQNKSSILDRQTKA